MNRGCANLFLTRPQYIENQISINEIYFTSCPVSV